VNFTGPAPSLNSGGTGTKNGLITVSNTTSGATAGPFTFTAAPAITTVSVPAGGIFSIAGAAGTNPCVSGTVLNPGQSCTIPVQYVTGGSTADATATVTVTGTGYSSASRTSGTFDAN
jgi:hypothetical protein